jgi:MoaA/NifB/PqqE/SkfB family radical SAM enzyme
MNKKFNEQEIIFVNKSEVSSHSVEQLHSSKLNYWKDWWCSAGMRSLYIQHDGVIYRGTCAVGDSMGSIYNEWIDNEQLLKHWVKCTKEVCACGTDMQTPKVKNKEDIQKIQDINFDNFNIIDQVQDPEMILSHAYANYKLVIWEIGRRCNYDCWYCIPASHNNFEGHKSLGTFKSGLDNLNREWAKGQKIKFVFTGGEPTFNPDFLDFVTYLHDDLHHIVHTTTNGSHTSEYYTKLMQVSDIGFSAHLTYLETPNIYKKFINNIETALKSKQSNNKSNLNWLGVRIMLQPGKLEIAKRLYDDCKAIIDNVTIDLLHGKNKKILDYSQEEINWLQKVQG